MVAKLKCRAVPIDGRFSTEVLVEVAGKVDRYEFRNKRCATVEAALANGRVKAGQLAAHALKQG